MLAVTRRRNAAMAVIAALPAACGQDTPEPDAEITPAPTTEPSTTTTAAPTTTVAGSFEVAAEPEPVAEEDYTAPTLPPWTEGGTHDHPYLPESEAMSEAEWYDRGEWAIPASVVACESGGSWDAENASGAAGPYQLMPEHFGGESALDQSPDAQHAKAAELWAGGAGASNWEQCL